MRSSLPMGDYAILPITFVRFWFLETPLSLLKFFGKLNKAFFELFSLPLLLRTFFKPLKNEYREGLVRFSIFMGIGVKSVLILANFLFLIPLLLFELFVVVLFIMLPMLAIGILFI